MLLGPKFSPGPADVAFDPLVPVGRGPGELFGGYGGQTPATPGLGADAGEEVVRSRLLESPQRSTPNRAYFDDRVKATGDALEAESGEDSGRTEVASSHSCSRRFCTWSSMRTSIRKGSAGLSRK